MNLISEPGGKDHERIVLVCCGVLWRAVVCCAVLCCAVLCCAVVWCGVVWCGVVLVV